ncbi:hypothetical protein ATSB10_25340 [Dyella thiooxydans]|uniref:Uncharacterized protein n=1 Tax=Dyella thiooxydans TaxID=445710 RepID=A0A160N3E6_9GAMM|nr:hypothetical protein ATSB10_25340 [Dyella thiooxydans]
MCGLRHFSQSMLAPYAADGQRSGEHDVIHTRRGRRIPAVSGVLSSQQSRLFVSTRSRRRATVRRTSTLVVVFTSSLRRR